MDDCKDDRVADSFSSTSRLRLNHVIEDGVDVDVDVVDVDDLGVETADAAPMAPPGWKPLNTSAGPRPGVVCKLRAVASARASPSASATVVDVVGADTPNEVSSSTWTGAGSRIVMSER